MSIRKIYSGQDKEMNGDWTEVPAKCYGEFMMIDKDKIFIDRLYQRDPKKEEAIARAFSWRLFGVVSVVLRDKKYFAYDGQCRTGAACMRNEIKQVPCVVYPSLGVKQEAGDFIKIQKHRSQVTALESFKARLAEGDEIVIDIQRIADENGFKVRTKNGGSGDVYSLACIGACERAYKAYGKDYLDFALGVSAVWYDGKTNGGLIVSLASLEKKLNSIEDSLGDYKHKIGIYEEVLREAKGISVITGDALTTPVYEAAILNLINKGKRKKVRV